MRNSFAYTLNPPHWNHLSTSSSWLFTFIITSILLAHPQLSFLLPTTTIMGIETATIIIISIIMSKSTRQIPLGHHPPERIKLNPYVDVQIKYYSLPDNKSSSSSNGNGSGDQISLLFYVCCCRWCTTRVGRTLSALLLLHRYSLKHEKPPLF